MTAPVAVEPPGPLEGAGVFSSYADVGKAVTEQDAPGVAVAATVAGLDTLSLVMEPLDELGAAGVGWAIERFAFLREPLDRLCGDARQIEARAKDWQQISGELLARAADVEAVLARPQDWSGAAAAAFHGTVADRADAVRRLSGAAHDVADVVLASASAVGTERAIVRDLIAEFVVWLVPKLLAWAAGAAVTAGAAAPVGLAVLVLDAVELARTLARRVEAVVGLLAEAATVARRLEDTMRTGLLPGTAGAAAEEAVTRGQDAVLEYGKNDAARRATAAEWDAAAPPG
ncbi:WXG100 family type VII secretion target [Pseudonocardia spirodelae]|uniref:ESX-1 secretion-associated protein EspA/EspE-like domain-containing protein n=1 Tax=Pseudonocardia spirodelae TaxID=3133431 RepID=A0ABU8T770_9PSEU